MKKKKTFIDGSTSTLPQTRSKLQNYSIVQGAIKIYTEFRDPRGVGGGKGGGGKEGVNEGGKRGRETQPLLAGKIKKGIKLIYNAKGTGNKVILSCEKQKQQIKNV